MLLNLIYTFSVCFTHSARFRWRNIAFRMGNRSCTFCESGHIGSSSGGAIHRRRWIGKHIRQCIPGHLSHIRSHRANNRIAVASLWASACRTNDRRIAGRAAQEKPDCRAARVAGRLSGRLDGGAFEENHCIYLETLVELGGASQGAESAGPAGSDAGLHQRSFNVAMGSGLWCIRVCCPIQWALFDASIHAARSLAAGIPIPPCVGQAFCRTADENGHGRTFVNANGRWIVRVLQCCFLIRLQELFKRLLPHQCLGATWSRRDKNEANTVVATVTQFNAVSYRVISSILIEPKLRAQVGIAANLADWLSIRESIR